MNDRERFEAYLAVIDGKVHDQEETLTLAKTLVEKNQNENTRDGSFTDDQWRAARDALSTLDDFKRCMVKVRQ